MLFFSDSCVDLAFLSRHSVQDCPLSIKAIVREAVHSFIFRMYQQMIIILFLSALGLSLAQNQQCSTLADYKPALVYCAIKYPVTVPIVTNTITKTVTIKSHPTQTAAVTSQITTTPKVGQGSGTTQTMTAVVVKTVTNCDHIPFPTCLPELDLPVAWPSILNGELSKFVPREVEERDYRGFGGSSGFSQALAWMEVLTQGDMAARNLCSCIQPRPSKTATVSSHTRIHRR